MPARNTTVDRHLSAELSGAISQVRRHGTVDRYLSAELSSAIRQVRRHGEERSVENLAEETGIAVSTAYKREGRDAPAFRADDLRRLEHLWGVPVCVWFSIAQLAELANDAAAAEVASAKFSASVAGRVVTVRERDAIEDVKEELKTARENKLRKLTLAAEFLETLAHHVLRKGTHINSTPLVSVAVRGLAGGESSVVALLEAIRSHIDRGEVNPFKDAARCERYRADFAKRQKTREQGAQDIGDGDEHRAANGGRARGGDAGSSGARLVIESIRPEMMIRRAKTTVAATTPSAGNGKPRARTSRDAPAKNEKSSQRAPATGAGATRSRKSAAPAKPAGGKRKRT